MQRGTAVGRRGQSPLSAKPHPVLSGLALLLLQRMGRNSQDFTIHPILTAVRFFDFIARIRPLSRIKECSETEDTFDRLHKSLRQRDRAGGRPLVEVLIGVVCALLTALPESPICKLDLAVSMLRLLFSTSARISREVVTAEYPPWQWLAGAPVAGIFPGTTSHFSRSQPVESKYPYRKK
jgi:hypothetical protein